ncbi:hypothetical protein BLA39750_00601 [Burkholderia lata]|uniref:Uncharacterized protein n=1 Tax=Burkholderia lata (strain ATCC 17760 / DSM 23089 / LMG 22485 / NCIMB 9086 / R18194 / 383) TaxID=482957 RepID=A0A6P2USR5_BURL3|nr:hypothetical protein BLA39750_00601 [Burkholderia lata]
MLSASVMRDIRGGTFALNSIERTGDVRCFDDEPARDADGRIRMNTDDLAVRAIDEILRFRTRPIVRIPIVLRQCAGRAAAWYWPDTSYPKHGFVQCAARFRAASFSRPPARADRTDCAMRVARTHVNALRRPVGSAVLRPFRSQVGRTLPHASAGHSRLSAGARFTFLTRRRAFACVRPSRYRPDRLPAAATPLSLSPPLRGFSTPQ